MEKNMTKQASLSIVENKETHQFLMIRHHRGINEGFINFPGGKQEPAETMEQCVIRETFEETGITIKNPIQVGYIEFPEKDFFVHIFKSTEFLGKINEKQDEVNAFWQDIDSIPYDEMREADRDFLPDILAGKYVKKRYIYDENFHIKEIIDL
ncbi:MAG: 8-oxo-dGTP diphosphatase [Alphaproteobacteria bacterium]|nr:8-oxo-dGTP diphosphatase [Alphaproteobacteria bacterium]